MSKNLFTCNYPNQQTPAMSTSHTYTVGAASNIISADDEDDNDICPVCDGECTCDNRPRLPHPTPANGSSSSSHGNGRHAVPTLASNSMPHLPSLKIKLTVPPNMLAKRRPSALVSRPNKSKTTFSGNEESSGQSLRSQGFDAHGLQDSAKRRGRPPKALRTSKSSLDQHPLGHYTPSQVPRAHKRKDALSSRITQRNSTSTLLPTKLKDKGTTAKKAAARKKKRTLSGSSGSELTDLDDLYDDDDAGAQFPTFVSASVMSTSTSSSSGSDTGSLSDFDTDSSIEAEEENYILTEGRRTHDRAHVRRELLGDEGQKKKVTHNNWVIRPRKKSVGPSDVEMDVDSEDATEDGEDDDDDEEGEDEDEPDDRVPGVGYAGVATGWSEDEESSFDADLFFSNLTDSSDNGSSSADTDGEQSDLDAISFSPMTREELDTLPFEVTESWDGQIVFSNGLREGQGILDIDFEVNAAQLLDSGASSSQTGDDVEMQASDGEDNEYEADGDLDCGESDGETTEEELVDDNGLPTERAMKLFRLPSSVSAINPLSTMSPGVSPAPRNRKRYHNSPKPADILAGKIFYEDSDEYDHDMAGPGEKTTARSVTSSSSRAVPTMGHFELGDANPSKRAIIDGSTKDVPSPFPRTRRRTGKPGSRLGSFSGMEHTRSSSLPLASPKELAAASPELPPTKPIDLDDVLEASFLDSEPQALANSSSEGDSRKHLQNLSRWDLISVGAFRQTRQANLNEKGSASWISEPPSTSDPFAYGSMIKTSPLSTMLWHHKGRNTTGRTAGRSRDNMNVVISPVILPVRDGDRTPTSIPSNHTSHSPRIPHHGKTRKELRKDKKLKRKSIPPVPYQHRSHHYHYHQHHPNSKSRSSSSMQRINSMSSVPPLNL